MTTFTHTELKQASSLAFGVLGYGSSLLDSKHVDSLNQSGTQETGTSFATDPCEIAAIVPASGFRW